MSGTDSASPQGGGAIAGLGETFSPDLHTGTGNLTIPLPLTKGRNGLTPALTLSYSSGAGNGPFGLGWDISVPRIARRTDKSLPTYRDTGPGSDTFLLAGAEEFAPVPLGDAAPTDLPDGASATRYRPRTETTFARIVHVTGAGQDYWDVRTQDGLRNWYGTPRPFPVHPDIPDDWTDKATICAPDRRIYAWLLSATVDPAGNHIRYEYRPDGPQRHLQSVEYADYGDPDNPSYAMRIDITYEGRPDPFSDRKPGFDLRTRLRGTRIDLRTPGTMTDTSGATRCELSYSNQTEGNAGADHHGHSLLTRVQFIGHDALADPRDEPTPPVTFAYRDFQPEARQYQRLTGPLPPTALAGSLDLVDLFGDGLPSLVQLDSGTSRYWRNLGNGHFDPPRALTHTPAGVTLGGNGVALADLDGDGSPELAVTDGTNLSVWALTRPDGDSLIQPGFAPVPLAVTAAPVVGLADAEVRLVDLDGNHRLDLLLAGRQPLIADGDGNGSFADLRPLHDAPPPLVTSGDPRVKLADMTGDGLTDVVWVHNGAVRYWPSLGHGRYDKPVDMGDPPTFEDAYGYGPVGFDPTRLLLGDVTGDGTADLIYVEDGRTRVWLNQCGNRYSAPTTIAGTPSVTSSTGVRLADLYGKGVTGIVWSGLGTDQHWAFLDLTGGTKPYLLTGIDNHRGARHTITWATSTQYATADRTAGQPWATSLPFPVHVVASSQTRDEFAHTVLTEAYTYHDGYWDPVDRELRGFGRIEHTDTVHRITNERAQPLAKVAVLDPLTPTSRLPDEFDANENGNLLVNWSFDRARDGQPRVLETTVDNPNAPGESAAEGWTISNDSPGRTTTTVEPSTLPMGAGGNMLRVTTTAAGCGVVQAFQPVDTGLVNVVASVWVYVVKGAVHLRTGGDGLDIAPDVGCDITGRWVLLEAGNQRHPARELLVYATGPDETEFLLDHAWVRVVDVPATPLDSPPVRTVTWFHPGPIGPTAGRWGLVSQLDQYWTGDPITKAQVDLSLLPRDLDPVVLRDALRALRGQVLRTEVYADDDNPFLSDRPYTVHTSRYQVAPVLDGRSPTDTGWLGGPVVTVQPTEATHTTWDRGNDPMTRHQLTGGYDEYGRPSVSTTVAVARGRRPDDPAGDPCLVTVARTEYATADRADLYRLDRVACTSRHEVLDPGTTSVRELAAAINAGDYRNTNAEVLRALEFTYYDGAAFTGLGCGELGDHGLPVRIEQLALTADLLNRLRQPLDSSGAAAPTLPYLADGGASSADWGREYPAVVQDSLTRHTGPHLGYQWHDESDTHVAGFYVQTKRLQYDLHDPSTPGRGLIRTSRAADGSDTVTTWDQYALHPATVTDAAGLTTSSEYDPQTLKATLVTDPNGNRTRFGWTPLGLPAWTARLGHADQVEGDTVEHPGISFTYRLLDYDDTAGAPDTRLKGQPVSVTTTRRVDHVSTLIDRENKRRAETGQPPLTQIEADAMFGSTELEEHPERFVVAVEFSDGLGRLLQTRTQADPLTVDDLGLDDVAGQARRDVTIVTIPGRVVVSGWRVMDNKGREALSYEPFFDDGYLFTEPGPGPLAGHAVTQHHYDPRGRATVTVAPDGSQTLIVHGRPLDVRRPARYEPTPWQAYSYGAAANGGRTHPTTTLPERTRWNATTHSEVDALGRVVHVVQRATDHDLHTYTSYDIEGRVLTVTDPLGRDIARHRYDHRGQEWTSWMLDAGHRHTARDATGAIFEQLDDRGARHVIAFDGAHRPTRTWARDRATQALTLRHWSVYGDESPQGAAAAAANVLGRIVFHCDGAGQTHTPAYDLGGEPRRTAWRPIRVDLLLAGLPDSNSVGWDDTSYAVDWPAPGASGADDLLETIGYVTEVEYDALGRPVTDTLPEDSAGHRTRIERVYGLGGAVTGVTVDGHPYVVRTMYDAHGRRQVVHLANGTLTRYTYDPRNLQLRRRRTDTGAEVTASGWTCGASAPINDHTFRYDLAGNILTLADRTPGCGIPPVDLNALDRQFSYDTLDRLLTATGRETDLVPVDPWIDVPRSDDPTRARHYRETYRYDDVGNLIHLAHATDRTARGAYSRTLTLASGCNRLKELESQGLHVPYAYDATGNVVREADNRRFEWDHAGRLVTFRDQAGATPTVYAQYRYHGGGERALKLVRRGELTEVTVDVGAFRRIARTSGHGNERYDRVNLLHGLDRVATIRTSPVDTNGPFPDQVILYEATDHVASVTDTLSATGELLNREEYLPFGETCFGSYTHKRHRYTGRERDEESGLSYHHARYYLPWLARWASCDPAGHIDGPSLYLYARDNPIRFIDPKGQYAEAGHYYTVYMVSLAAGFPPEVAYRNAVHAQMPDEAEQYDAKALGVGAVVRPFDRAAAERRDEVYAHLHALTGGEAQQERSATRSALSQATPGTFEFGMLLHRFGDSYAHTNEATGHTYGPPAGHLSEGTKPDQIELRPQLYGQYVTDLYQTLSKMAGKQGYSPRATLPELGRIVSEVPDARGDPAQIAILRFGAASLGVPMTAYAPENEDTVTLEAYGTRHPEFLKEGSGPHWDFCGAQTKTQGQLDSIMHRLPGRKHERGPTVAPPR